MAAVQRTLTALVHKLTLHCRRLKVLRVQVPRTMALVEVVALLEGARSGEGEPPVQPGS